MVLFSKDYLVDQRASGREPPNEVVGSKLRGTLLCR